MSYENSKIHVENLEKEIRHKDNIIDQLLLDSIISGIDEKRLSEKYLLKVHPFPAASADDIHHYLRPLLQKCPDTTILHVGTSNCVSKFSTVVLNKILNLRLPNTVQNNNFQCYQQGQWWQGVSYSGKLKQSFEFPKTWYRT